MKKQLYKGLLDQIEPIHRAGDQNNYQSYHPFDSHRMIEQTGDPLGEEVSLEEEASLAEEDFPEVEASPEEEDTPEEEEYHLEDHQEAVGDRHRCRFHKSTKES